VLIARIFLILLIFVGASIASADTAGRHVSSAELRAEKHGRVVDADTGAGIPDVKMIANWRTRSDGVPGLVSGGIWCDLQTIVATDAQGNYTIPDISSQLDLSDRGTAHQVTRMGPVNVTHDADWLLIAFKPGYVRTGDKDKLRAASFGELGGFVWESTPETAVFRQGEVEINPISMHKEDLAPPSVWVYDSKILAGARCRDRMAHDIDQPEMAEIAKTMDAIVRPLPCTMPADTALTPIVRKLFTSLVNDKHFFDRLTAALGNPWVWDDKDVPAGVLCRALTEQGTGQ